MGDEYIQSEEFYKGYVLKIRLYRLDDQSMVYHRNCDIYKDGKRIGISKTKKEAKDLISNGYMK